MASEISLYQADEIRKMLLKLIKAFVVHWIDPSVEGSYDKVEEALKELGDAAYIIADEQEQLEMLMEDDDNDGESTGQLIDVEVLKHG